jgi:hypothetical protein
MTSGADLQVRNQGRLRAGAHGASESSRRASDIGRCILSEPFRSYAKFVGRSPNGRLTDPAGSCKLEKTIRGAGMRSRTLLFSATLSVPVSKDSRLFPAIE